MEENRGFTSFDTVSVLALTLGVVVLITSIVAGALSDNKNIQARRQADEIAARLAVNGLRLEENTNPRQNIEEGRQPSSLGMRPLGSLFSGQVGMDPWGNPYRYTILRAADGHSYVAVVSGGSNGVIETKFMGQQADTKKLATRLSSPGSSVAFAGDDIGVIQSHISEADFR